MLNVNDTFSSPATLKGEVAYECFIKHTSLNYTEEKDIFISRNACLILLGFILYN